MSFSRNKPNTSTHVSLLSASCCQEAQTPSSLQICLTENYKELPLFARFKVQTDLQEVHGRKLASFCAFKFDVHKNLVCDLWLLSILHLAILPTSPSHPENGRKYQVNSPGSPELGENRMPHQQSIPGLWFYSLLLGFSPKNWIMPLPRSIGHWILDGREIKIRPSHSRPGKGENNNLKIASPATHTKRVHMSGTVYAPKHTVPSPPPSHPRSRKILPWRVTSRTTEP